MNDDAKLTGLLNEVASDVPDTSDQSALDGLRRAADGPSGSSWIRRGSLAVVTAAAVLLAVFGAAQLLGDDGEEVDVATTDGPAEVTAEELTGAEFRFVEGDDALAAVDDVPYLRFDSQHLSWSGGCNGIGAEWRLEGNRLVVGEINTTDIGCEGPAGAADDALTSLISSEPSVQADGERLILSTGDRGVVFARTDGLPDELAGTWRAVEVQPPDAVALVEPVTLELSAGRFDLDATCFGSSGELVVDGQRLDWRQQSVGPQPCEAGTPSPIEEIDRFFQRSVEWNVDGDTLTLADDQGATLLLERASSPTSPDEQTSETSTAGGGEEPSMVVVDNLGSRVTVYRPDGSPPDRFAPPEPVAHASLSADGSSLWLTFRQQGQEPTSILRQVDPATGQVVEEIEGAGYAVTSPDGSRLAYSIVSFYGGVEQAVVIRDVSTGEERTVPGDTRPRSQRSVVGAFEEVTWSPDGTRLTVEEAWEDDVVWVFDPAVDARVSDGDPLSVRGVDWLSPERLLATEYCCYGEVTEPRHLVEVDLSGDEPAFEDRSERADPITAAVPDEGLSTAVYVDPDGVLRRLADGTEIARDVVSASW